MQAHLCPGTEKSSSNEYQYTDPVKTLGSTQGGGGQDSLSAGSYGNYLLLRLVAEAGNLLRMLQLALP